MTKWTWMCRAAAAGVALALFHASLAVAQESGLEEAVATYRATAGKSDARAAAAAALISSLDSARAAVHASRKRDVRAALAADVLPPAIELLGDAEPTVHEAALHLVAACGSKAALDALDSALRAVDDSPAGIAALAAAVSESRTGATLAWFVSVSPRVWAAVGAAPEPDQGSLKEKTLAALTTAVSPLSESVDEGLVDPRDARRLVENALKKVLRGASGREGFPLAVALARIPGKPARDRLADWLEDVEDLPDERRARVLEELGNTGDEAAVSLLLGHVEDTSGTVFAATLLAISRCSLEALAKHGKAVLGATIPLWDKEYREARSLIGNPNRDERQAARLALLESRGPAWHSTKLVDVPPKQLPPGVTGVRGFAALWWRVVDCLDGRIRPPQVPKNAMPKYLNGRPNLQPVDWLNWWRSAK